MFKNYLKIGMMAMLAMSFMIMSSCDDDESAAPTISLSQTTIDAKAGETISVDITYESEAGAKSITVTKLWDGTAEGSPQTATGEDLEGDLAFDYDVTEEDADHVLTFNFLIEDNDGQTGQVELVVNVELTMRQLLLKYDWALTDEIRNKTGESDITDAYTDDVYRFSEDGTYVKSIGEKVDDFGDLVFVYCKWNLNETTGRLLMQKSGFGDLVDTLDITTINADVLEADITYYGLDFFNNEDTEVPYEYEEGYVKKFSAQAKGSSFDPYHPGAEDDAGPAECNDEIVLEND